MALAMGPYPMLPANPPLPTPWNLPFQFEAGSQTSTWMLESAEGLMTSATRQKAGTLGIGGPSGGVKDPAGTDCAVVTVAPGSVSSERPAHGVAAAEAEAARRMRGRSFILAPVSDAIGHRDRSLLCTKFGNRRLSHLGVICQC